MVHRKTINGLFAAATCAGVLAIPTTASAQSPSWGLKDAYDTVYERVERADGDPGRHIVDDGVREDGESRSATRREVKESLATLRAMSGEGVAAASAASGDSDTTGSSTATGGGGEVGSTASTGGETTGGGSGSAGSGLDAIASCESGGDPSAVSSDGTYRGKYQFDQQTWESVGGSGDPAAASEGEQDERAAALQAQRGSSPWPTCG